MFILFAPSVLSCFNRKLHQTLEVKNICKQKKIMFQITFKPGLTLTVFQTTRPWDLPAIANLYATHIDCGVTF